MALSEKASEVKQQMMAAVTLRRELESVEGEWRDLLALLEDTDDEGVFAVATEIELQRRCLRRALTEQRLHNWARISAGRLTPPQRRLLGLRFVQGCPWGVLVERMGHTKQYLLREHNKALEALSRP